MGLFTEKIRFVTALDLIKCLKQRKKMLLTCRPISKLPSFISIMVQSATFKDNLINRLDLRPRTYEVNKK